ncbi:hypothetical protein ONE63_011489 [Megalurothrips usitatus]|uniref:JmjC domain-containing protein n=1 Tax=Megalurothrips usitatus TaxID=439358 RepID=A0AAV7X3A3_9NEOP|nr:hypothetical protein ONE63_011489 [Megalurothrips usitatus]
MFRCDVDRVAINSDDHDWETAFIPWLEDNEKKKVGVEDGVFVASIDPGLRVLQPQDEERFVRHCSQHRISDVSTLMLSEYVQKGVFTYATAKAGPNITQEFKERMGHVQAYKTDTCCTSILKQGESSVENLFDHIDSDVLNHIKKTARSGTGYGSTRSRVIMEESGLKVQQLYQNYHQNTKGFAWEKRLKAPPLKCPELECQDQSSYDENEKDANSGCMQAEKRSKLECRSIRGMHVEDALTWSLNYLYLGHPKVWVVIPPWATELLEFHLRKSGILLNHASCTNILGHKSVLPTVRWLKEREIPFKVIVQHPGDMVVLYPSAAHFGFNLGPNIAQAINIATISWIPWGLNAKKCLCTFDQIHLDISPLVAAFRGDILSHLLRGGTVVVPETLRGMLLVKDLVMQVSDHKLEEEHKLKEEHKQPTVKCPVSTCSKTFPQSPVETVKQDMTKHVKATHKPVLVRAGLLKKIDELFKVQKGENSDDTSDT